jgi:sugar/nucleoside kinase (ribokinase family)
MMNIPVSNPQGSDTSKQIDVIVLGSLILDDVVFTNGKTSFEQVGGSAAYAAAGAKLTGLSTGVWSFAGQDYYSKFKHHLENNGINTDGIIRRDTLQPRAWQLFSKDDSRIEVFQTPWPEVRMQAPLPHEWPNGISCSAGYIFWSHDIAKAVTTFRRSGARFLVWEPPDDLTNPSRDQESILSVLSLMDAVCPNINEWKKLFNLSKEEEIINLALSAGVKLIALRLGEKGSILAAQAGIVRLPVEIISHTRDFTGAGNAYAGALAAAMLKHGIPMNVSDLQRIGAFATVASAMTIESLGIPKINPHKIQLFFRRVRNYIQRLS